MSKSTRPARSNDRISFLDVRNYFVLFYSESGYGMHSETHQNNLEK